MKKLITRLGHLFLILLTVAICFTSWEKIVHADENDIPAKAAITMDAQTGQILYQKNANQLLAVASCTKILTLAVIEQDVANGHLRWNQKVIIDGHVAKMSNDWRFSNVELKRGHSYTIRELAESMMIVSADGSAAALAIADAGSTKAFNEKMVTVAKRAGVRDAKIYNMVGLSNGEMGHYGLKGVSKKTENAFSAKDMALIARYLVNNYPDALNITKQLQAEFNVDDHQKFEMHNINGMLPNNGEAPKNGTMDGLKTGSTDKAGNCFVGTGVFNNRRLITVVLGTDKHDFSQQFKATNNMLNAVQEAYQPAPVSNIKTFRVVNDTVKVAHSKQSKVKVNIASQTALWVPKNGSVNGLAGQVTLSKHKRTLGRHKLRAPLKKGETVGNVQVTPIKGLPSVKLPMIAQQSVQKHSIFH